MRHDEVFGHILKPLTGQKAHNNPTGRAQSLNERIQSGISLSRGNHSLVLRRLEIRNARERSQIDREAAGRAGPPEGQPDIIIPPAAQNRLSILRYMN